MKKTILHIALLATITAGGGGCKKFLNEKPLSQVEIDKYFKNVRDINAAITGVYTSFQQEMTGGGTDKTWGKYFYWGEGRADNFEKSQYNFGYVTEMAFNGLTSGNAAATWAGLYRTIGRANNCIKYIPQVPKYDRQATKTIVNNALAQAYAMRAMSYFYIIRLWGDAPIWLEPYTDVYADPMKPRESKDKIINEVILPDLKMAYDLIQKGQNAPVWYVGEGAICAILADVYMWLGKEDEAMPWFTSLFSAKGPSGKTYNGVDKNDLVATRDDWKKIFLNANTIENIWSIHWDFAVNNCACIPASVYWSNSPLSLDLIAYDYWRVQTWDFRARQTIDFNAGSLRDRMQKYTPVPNTGNPSWSGETPKQLPVYLVMYRLTDMMLLYAEALNNKGDLEGALKWTNIVRTRAGHTAYLPTNDSVSTQANMQMTLLHERRWELFGEGKRWFDLIRNGKVKEIMDPVLKSRQRRYLLAEDGFLDDEGRRLLWPINRTLIENNPLLEQNKPYN